MPGDVATPEQCVAFVETCGLCAWRPGTPLRCLEDVTPWGHDTMLQTWFWKDDLHLAKQLYYGQLWGAGVPVFAAQDLLPALVAAQGDTDPQDLFETGRISRVALHLYRHIERHGPTPKNRLPYPPNTSQTPPLVQLQQTFLLTKVGLTGRRRGTYGYLWDRFDAFHPEILRAAARLEVADARQQIRDRLRAAGQEIPERVLAKALRWPT